MNTEAPSKRPKAAAQPAVLRLLESWRRETSYDAQAWPRVRRALAKNRLCRRAAFND